VTSWRSGAIQAQAASNTVAGWNPTVVKIIRPSG
jgi:hypothetical protein